MGRMELSHDEVRELIVPYVLGALSPEEAPFVRAHILSCDECMAEADSYSDVAAKMALSADPIPLPDDFADKVMATATEGAAEVAAEVPLTPARAAGRSRRFRFGLVPALASLAVVLAIAVLSVSLVRTRGQLDVYERVVSSVLHSDEGMELRGAGAVARVVPTSGGSVFAATGMQEAPDNHTYELWFVDDGRPVSAGTFSVTNGVAVLESSRSLGGFEAAAVTIEPAGGSPDGRPSTDPIMTAVDPG
jgi:anti-sigma-K factor RskA